MLGVQRLRELLVTRVWEGGRAVVASTALPSNLFRVSRQTTMATKASTAVPLEEDEVLTEDRFGTKIAVLNRPRKLNALTPRMVSLLLKLYEGWEKDPHVHLVILKAYNLKWFDWRKALNPADRCIEVEVLRECLSVLYKGNGKGFCAGGDVAAVSSMGAGGNVHGAVDFFKHEYILNYMIGTYKKPHIAFLDGVVMGGGTGVSLHGRFRVATENTVFAMPETAIGLHPDVGATYYLPRLPGHLGEYLALTGTRLDGADMMATSLATHFVPSHRLKMLEERLGGLNTEDIDVISNAVDEHCDIVQLKEKSPLHRRTEIDSCFGRSSMEEIVRTLEAGTKTGNPWYQETLNTLGKMSPISLKIALRSVREGRRQTLHQCLEREFLLSYHILTGRFSKDFVEGCRALLIDKDNSPKWNPPVLEQVSSEMVDHYFSAIQGEDHGLTLQLPVEEREGQLKSGRYSRL